MSRTRQTTGSGRRRRMLIATTMVAAIAGAAPGAAAAADDTYNGSELWLRYVPVSEPACSRVPGQRHGRGRRERGPPRSTARRRTCTWRPERPRSSSRPPSRRRGTNSCAASVGCSGSRCRWRTTPGDVPDGAVVVGTRESSATVRAARHRGRPGGAGDEGYLIRSLSTARQRFTVIAGNTEVGALYGTFAFLRLTADAEADHEPGRLHRRRRSRTATSTTGTPSASTPATTRPARAGSTARTERSSTSPPPAPSAARTCR